MKNFIVKVFLTTVLISPNLVSAEPDHSAVEIKVTQITDGIYMLAGAGGNIGVLAGEDGVLMIDDQFSDMSDKINAELVDLGYGQVDYLLNTHWHGDHTGGNAQFGDVATIIAHEHVRDRLMTRQEVKLFNMVSEPQPKVALPVITFEQGLKVHFNNEEIKMMHLPNGHTDGDSVIFFKNANVVHMGDLFFNGMYPFIDLDSGGDVRGFADNVATILKQIPQQATIIPGHGPLAKTADLKAFHAMLVETMAIVQSAIDNGLSLEQTQAAGFPDEIVEKWGQGFLKTEVWIGILYEGLS